MKKAVLPPPESRPWGVSAMYYAIVRGIRGSWVCPNGRHRYRCTQARSLSQGVGRSGGEPGAVAMQCGARFAVLFAARTGREWPTVAEARVPCTSRARVRWITTDKAIVSREAVGHAVSVSRRPARQLHRTSKHKQFQHRPLAATQPVEAGASGICGR